MIFSLFGHWNCFQCSFSFPSFDLLHFYWFCRFCSDILRRKGICKRNYCNFPLPKAFHSLISLPFPAKFFCRFDPIHGSFLYGRIRSKDDIAKGGHQSLRVCARKRLFPWFSGRIRIITHFLICLNDPCDVFSENGVRLNMPFFA